MSIYSEIDRLELAKENIKLKLESKGITVPADARISDYAALINLLPEIKESEFINRIVDNGNSGTGKAKIYSIKGKTLVWNQLVQNGNFANGTSDWTIYAVISSVANGILTLNTPNANNLLVSQTIVGISEHKYLGFAYVKTTSSQVFFRFGNGNANHSGSGNFELLTRFYTKTLSNVNPQIRDVRTNNYDDVQVKNITVFDLTLLFGAGNEPSTVEEFEAMFPEAYYPYNEGTLINNDAEAIESIGFNQFDLDAPTEYLPVTGVVGSERYVKRIKVLPGTYYIKSIGINVIYFKTVINGIYGQPGNLNDNRTITIDTLGEIWIYSSDNNILNDNAHNICINIFNPAKNGTYESYKKFTLPLGLNSFRVKDSEDNIITINGLKSAGSVYDEIVGNKYIKRVGEVDLGTLNWNYDSTRARFLSASNLNALGIMPGMNALCSKYEVSNSITAISTDKQISINGSAISYIAVKNFAYTDAATFKTAMSGIIFYYELATPIEYELVDEIDTIYDVDKNGVEKIISPVHADGSPSAPFRVSIGYPVNQE